MTVQQIPATAIDEVESGGSLTTELGTEVIVPTSDGRRRVFRFVETNQDADISAGDCLVYADGMNYQVTPDTSGDANGRSGEFAGIAHVDSSPSTDSENKGIWVQVQGPRTEADLNDASNGVTDGDYVVPDSTNDAECAAVTANSDAHEAFAIAQEAASGGTFKAYLLGRH